MLPQVAANLYEIGSGPAHGKENITGGEFCVMLKHWIVFLFWRTITLYPVHFASPRSAFHSN